MIRQNNHLDHKNACYCRKNVDAVHFNGHYERNGHENVSNKNGTEGQHVCCPLGFADSHGKGFPHQDKIKYTKQGPQYQTFPDALLAGQNECDGDQDGRYHRP